MKHYPPGVIRPLQGVLWDYYLTVPATSLLLMLVQITFASFGSQVTSLAQVAFTVN